MSQPAEYVRLGCRVIGEYVDHDEDGCEWVGTPPTCDECGEEQLGTPARWYPQRGPRGVAAHCEACDEVLGWLDE